MPGTAVNTTIYWMVSILIYLRHPRTIVAFRRIVGYFPNVAVPKRYNEKKARTQQAARPSRR